MATGSRLYPIDVDEKFGYIDATGSVVVEPQFDGADDFHEGFAQVTGISGESSPDRTAGQIGFIGRHPAQRH